MVKFHVLTLNPKTSDSLKYFCSLRLFQNQSIQLFSCIQLFETPWTGPMPGLPVHHQFPESTQTHVHWVNDAIQPSHPLSSPSPSAFNLSQHQGLPMSQLFTSGGQSIGASASASVLPMNIQDWFRMDWLDLLAVQETFKNLFQHHDWNKFHEKILVLLLCDVFSDIPV